MKISDNGMLNIQKQDFIQTKKNNDIQKNENNFDKIYQKILEGFNNVNILQKEADNASLDLALGKTDNIHNVMIAQEKASIALQFTVEVRNKVLEAYNQIMRMPM